MTTEEYRNIWQEAIRLCEIEQNEQEAKEFVHKYYNSTSIFERFSDKELLITFVGLVVYETRFCGYYGYGSTTPTKFCYRELQNRCSEDKFDREFILDVGDWAADYATNPYIPMDTYRGFGPREHYKFWNEYEERITAEKVAKEERIAKLREQGRKKVEAAKLANQKRLNSIEELKAKTLEESLKVIENSGKSIYYYFELIEYWFSNNMLDNHTKTYILSLFPTESTKHNKKLKKKIENLY